MNQNTLQGFPLLGYVWGSLASVVFFCLHAICGTAVFYPPTLFHLGIFIALTRGWLSVALSLVWVGGLFSYSVWDRPSHWWVIEIVLFSILLKICRHYVRPNFATYSFLFWITCLSWSLGHTLSYSVLWRCLFLYGGLAFWLICDAWKTRARVANT